MKLAIYKGFSKDFLEKLHKKPLIESTIESKKNVLKFDKNTRKRLQMALISLNEKDEVWATYEEFSFVHSYVENSIEEDGLELIIYRNNIYPEWYPLEFNISDTIFEEITQNNEGVEICKLTNEGEKYLHIYSHIIRTSHKYYGSFYNYEYEYKSNNHVKVLDFYPTDIKFQDEDKNSEFNIFLNGDLETYLKDLEQIERSNFSLVGIKSMQGEIPKKIELSFYAYCLKNHIRITKYHEKLKGNIKREHELIEIIKNDIGIRDFRKFRNILFYENPDIDKKTISISQSQIICEIIEQAEFAYNDKRKNKFRDIFITASTGAGKSLMFQVPAVYLAKKYHKLTIVIEPVKALMQDQKNKLNNNGYNRVEVFNSDLITQIEKEKVLERIKKGEVDLLYLSPETLLSYSIETIIGDREIGLLIVDEAHIVTTWGFGFRPDYWYLGGYINKLRHQIQYNGSSNKKIFHFPICAFTATAINGGIDDSVSDTIISLCMENPIKYIGNVRRENIQFKITLQNKAKLPKIKYEELKAKNLKERIEEWIMKGEKTIVYFPYASYAWAAKRGVKSFSEFNFGKTIGLYTGRNVDELSNETFTSLKRDTFERFKKGNIKVMFATKAFGMGIDIDDIQNIYHYAVTGNLCDYVQEIGRAARNNAQGYAITDYYYNDISFMNKLFGMSQIRQYQIKKILSGIYDTYKSKNGKRNFLISPESFTYIFGSHEENQNINKLKTCLLMIEKDLYDKYTFKVLIARPQSVFTKAFVVVFRENEADVLCSKYAQYFTFVKKGRNRQQQWNNDYISDAGDIYMIDLKGIWERYHSNISFPSFKYWYFNNHSTSKEKIDIMPGIRSYIAPRQKITIKTRGDFLLCDIQDKILEDFEYIANTAYEEKGNSFFSSEEFAKMISPKYGITQARIIVNSLFELVDPEHQCVKYRDNNTMGKIQYYISNGNFKEYMRRTINKSPLIKNLSTQEIDSYSGYESISNNNSSSIALKILSIFNYITYELVGGQEPEIFIRLNDPDKLKNIVLGNTFYVNQYVRRAKNKHDRDMQVLVHFFNDINGNEARWNYIENYFLGYDILEESDNGKNSGSITPLRKAIDKEHSYQTNQYKKWSEIANTSFFEAEELKVIKEISNSGIEIPDYLDVTIKRSNLGEHILMCWSNKNTIICTQDTDDSIIHRFKKMGWTAYRINEINIHDLRKKLNK